MSDLPLKPESAVEAARNAMFQGWNNCKQTNSIGRIGRRCDCDLGAIDGCKARIEAIANAIEAARACAQQGQYTLRDAADDLVNGFAWSAVQADCQEASNNLTDKLNAVRAALSASPQQGQEPPDDLTEALCRVIDGWRKEHPDLTYYETVTVIEGLARLLSNLRDEAEGRPLATVIPFGTAIDQEEGALESRANLQYEAGMYHSLYEVCDKQRTDLSAQVERALPLIQRWRIRADELQGRSLEMETEEESSLYEVDAERLNSCAAELFLALTSEDQNGAAQ